MDVNFSRKSADFSHGEPLLPPHGGSGSSIATRDTQPGTNLTAASAIPTEPAKNTAEKKTWGNRPSHPDLIGIRAGDEKIALARASLPEASRLLVEKWKGQCDTSFIAKKLNDGNIAFDPKSLALYQQKVAIFFDAVALNKKFQDLVEQFPAETDSTLPSQQGQTARFMNNEFDSKGEVVLTCHRGDHSASRSFAQTTDVGKEKAQIVLGCLTNYLIGDANYAWGLEIASKASFEQKTTES